MSKRQEKIDRYAADLRETFKTEPDMALLTKVVIGCGPAIYDADSETIAATNAEEVARVKTNFLMRKLGLADGKALDDAVAAVLTQYGSGNRNKYRAVVYYQLTRHFGRESVYA